MNTKNGLAVAGLAIILAAGSALADENDELDGTIRLMGVAEADLPGAVTEDIMLPVSAADDGIDTANAARMRRENGLDIAASASADARDNAAAMAEAAQENAENRSRADDNNPPDLPPGPPGG